MVFRKKSSIAKITHPSIFLQKIYIKADSFARILRGVRSRSDKWYGSYGPFCEATSKFFFKKFIAFKEFAYRSQQDCMALFAMKI